MKINREKFKKIYFEALEDIIKTRPITQELKDLLAEYEYDYKNYDFENYLRLSWKRAWLVYQMLTDPAKQSFRILDIGGFFGNISLCFQRLGYQVTMVEVYDYYGGAFDNLKFFLESEGVKIENKDFTKYFPQKYTEEKYDIILCLAVLEHLAHSPSHIFNNIKTRLLPNGFLILEVPNIAYWPKRIRLLKGESILAPIIDIYKSKEPYMGHHHEYTATELYQLAELANFKIEKIVFYNYSLAQSAFLNPFYFPCYLFSPCKEVILAKLSVKN